MKWLWRHRKSREEAMEEAEELVRRLERGTASSTRNAAAPTFEPGATQAPITVVARSDTPTRPLAPPIEPRDALLLFARDYLIARGARVRVEDDDLVTATLPAGEQVRYTTTLARARAEEETQLLVRGGGVLADLVEECAGHARVTALRLAPICDAAKVSQEACASPAAGCASCLSPVSSSNTADGVAICERCPLHDGKFVLDGVGRVRSVQVTRQWEAPSLELTYLLTSTDRQGRHDEWVRVAFDLANGFPITPLPIDRPLLAEAAEMPADLPELIAQAHSWAEKRLAPAMEGAAALLRLRSEGEFLAKLDDIRHTHNRLRRENSEESDAIDASMQREVERLRDVFAVEVSVNLDSVALITSPMAAVTLKTSRAGDVTLSVDLGRGAVIPPSCGQCGEAKQVGTFCAHGHFTCVQCCSHIADFSCSTCTGRVISTSPNVVSAATSDSLTLASLDALTPETWQSFVTWLLEREGVSVDRVDRLERTAGGTAYYGHAGDVATIAVSLRLPAQWMLGENDVRLIAALRAGNPDAHLLLVTTATAMDSAREVAAQLDSRLIDRAALEALLTRLNTAHVDDRAQVQQDIIARAERAAAVREILVASVQTLETQLAAAANTRKAAGGKSVTSATEAISAMRNELLRAFIAWETLAADWLAIFSEREARDGSLSISAGVTELNALAERGEHLTAATLDIFKRFVATPGSGPLGYSSWRQAIIEEWTAQLEALRWRFHTINLDEWQDFRRAHDSLALENAASAAASATHAVARVEKAQAQMESRIRLPRAASGE